MWRDLQTQWTNVQSRSVQSKCHIFSCIHRCVSRMSITASYTLHLWQLGLMWRTNMTSLLAVMACGISESARFSPILHTATWFALVWTFAALLYVTSRNDLLNLRSFTISRVSHVCYIRFPCHFICNTLVMCRRIGQISLWQEMTLGCGHFQV